jgi:XRE family transcriptional regulator, aerobic/anaerobic benzoate catabolism transcriptional regulator
MVSPTRLKSVSAVQLPADDADFLQKLGRRVRELRERRDVTRRVLAAQADVSERYLGQLETGEGNISIMLLRRVAVALKVPVGELLETEPDHSQKRLIRQFLEQIPRHRIEDLLVRLSREVGSEREARRNRIALIGLRGAGKSTLGERLASDLGVPFIEGRCLERVVKEHPRAVLSVGGGVVSEGGTYDFLLANCFTVWLKARPEEHMQRVIAQGDMRPMAESREAMEDLKRILAAREPQYRKADEIVDTSDLTVETAFARLLDLVVRSQPE